LLWQQPNSLSRMQVLQHLLQQLFWQPLSQPQAGAAQVGFAQPLQPLLQLLQLLQHLLWQPNKPQLLLQQLLHLLQPLSQPQAGAAAQVGAGAAHVGAGAAQLGAAQLGAAAAQPQPLLQQPLPQQRPQ
jgi:hypothetical protein